MKIAFGILRIISSIGFGFLAFVMLNSHFNLNDKFDKYQNLHENGVTTYASLSDDYFKTDLKIKMIHVKSYMFDYKFEVDNKEYGGKYSVKTLDSLKTKLVKVKYLKSDPSINSTDVEKEYEDAKKDIKSKNNLKYGIVLLLLFFVVLITGIRKIKKGIKEERQDTNIKHKQNSATKKNRSVILRAIQIKGFDKDGEPEIKLYKNNTLEIHFNFMPPLNGKENQSELEIFDSFDKKLSSIINKNVVWEDRELFVIKNATQLDVTKLKNYLESFWK